MESLVHRYRKALIIQLTDHTKGSLERTDKVIIPRTVKGNFLSKIGRHPWPPRPRMKHIIWQDKYFLSSFKYFPSDKECPFIPPPLCEPLSTCPHSMDSLCVSVSQDLCAPTLRFVDGSRHICVDLLPDRCRCRENSSGLLVISQHVFCQLVRVDESNKVAEMDGWGFSIFQRKDRSAT